MNNSRRLFLRDIGFGAAGIAVASLETACGSAARSPAPAAPDAAEEARSYFCPVLPASRYSTSRENGKLRIEINGAPSHLTGLFPNPNCPLPIVPRLRQFTVTLNPQVANTPTPLNGWLFGVAVSGVVFDPTGPFWSQATTGPGTWEFEVMSANGRPYLGLDGSCGHVQPSGEYHYHGMPYDLIAQLGQQQAGARMLLLGFAADGFPIYAQLMHDDPNSAASPLRAARSSYRVLSGERAVGAPKGLYDGTFVQDYEYVPGLGDLDECNGRFGVTPEYPDGIYHYHLTEQFPFVPRFYRGRPDPSFAHGSPGPFPNGVPPALITANR